MKMPRFVFAATVLLTVVVAAGPPEPRAADVSVECSAQALITAIETANADPESGRLRLAPDCTYTLETANNTGYHGDNGLPQILGTIAISGTRTVIQRGTDSAIPMFRLLQVNEGASLYVKGIEFRNGIDEFSSADEKGGAILNQGKLLLSDCGFYNNQAGCGGAIWTSGELLVSRSTFAANTGDN